MASRGIQQVKIFITGGSGSLGRALIAYYRINSPKTTLYSLTNNEFEHWELEKDLKLESFLCDIRDKWRIDEIIRTIIPDVVIHAAALKHVPYGERFPMEFHKTNVQGSKNVVEVCIANNIPKCIFISTDKAVKPTTNYGKTKAIAEFMFLTHLA
jgi:UDP-N-acetylglucosamine 4,6-dehydratase